MYTEVNREIITTAIIDGKEVIYDAVGVNRNDYDEKVFEYIGQGIIYKIDGVKQEIKRTLHFWKRI